MKAILNGKLIELDELTLSLENRGFKYGDGLFETIALPNGNPRLLELHLERLKEGADYLNLNVASIIQRDKVEEDLRQLQKSNHIAQDGIARLYIWRNAKGRYAPLSHNADSLLTMKNTSLQKVKTVQKAGFSEKTVNYPSGFSSFKTMNALKYVITGIEKEEKLLDEIIISDYQSHVSEALSSNIFWKKGKTFYTPSLSTGCISGVMRNWMMKALKQNGYTVEESLAGQDEFLDSECIFTTNATGIGYIKAIGQFNFEMDKISEQIIKQIS